MLKESFEVQQEGFEKILTETEVSVGQLSLFAFTLKVTKRDVQGCDFSIFS